MCKTPEASRQTASAGNPTILVGKFCNIKYPNAKFDANVIDPVPLSFKIGV